MYASARFIHEIIFAGGELEQEHAHESEQGSEEEHFEDSDDEENDGRGGFSEIQEQNFNFEDFINRCVT
jgi:hypothetical protein